nr:hypothetical protein [Luteimonas granuli]
MAAQRRQRLRGERRAGAGLVDLALEHADRPGVSARHVPQPCPVVGLPLAGIDPRQSGLLARVRFRNLQPARLRQACVERGVVVLELLGEPAQLRRRAAQLGRARGLHFSRTVAQGAFEERTGPPWLHRLPGGHAGAREQGEFQDSGDHGGSLVPGMGMSRDGQDSSSAVRRT